MPTVEELIGMMTEGTHETNEEHEDLVAMLTPVAKVATLLELKRAKLPQLLDPSAAPENAIRHLAATVGLGPELPAAYSLSNGDLRRLIVVAVALWKIKGTRPSWRNVISALTGSRCLIYDWFYLRTIDGSPARVHTIPGPGELVSGSLYSYPEFVTDVWFNDPADADRVALVARWLGEMRPANERINLHTALMVDDLHVGESQWTRQGSGVHVVDLDGYRLGCSDGAHFAADSAIGQAWTDYRITLRLTITGRFQLLLYRLTDGTDDCYRMEIDSSTSTWYLYRRRAAVDVLVATATVAMVEGATYRFTWTVDTDLTSTTVKVYFEGFEAINYTDTAGNRLVSGSWRWGAFSGAANSAILTEALVWGSGTLTATRIGLAT